MNHELRSELLKELATRAPHISANIAEDWLDNSFSVFKENARRVNEGKDLSEKETFESIKKEAMFHIKRLHGFGGSDIAVLLTEYRGLYHPFSSAKSILRSKLCLEPPSLHTGDTERGQVMEEFIKGRFLSSMSHYELKENTDAFDKLRKFLNDGGVKEHPWMHGMPDGVFTDKNNKVWLVDFKCPAEHSTVEAINDNPPDYYRAQLSVYRTLLERAGVKIDHMAVVPFSMKEMQVYVAEVPYDAQMEKDIFAAGDLYFSYLLSNEVPKREASQGFKYIKDPPPVIQHLSAKIIALSSLENRVKAISAKAKEEFKDLTAMFGIHDSSDAKSVASLCGLKISNTSRKGMDTDRMGMALIELGVDLKKFEKTSTGVGIRVETSKAALERNPTTVVIREMTSYVIDELLHDTKDLLDVEEPKINVKYPAEEKAPDLRSNDNNEPQF